ncbi:kunitz-like toxin PcKuz1 [Haemaphysalis longicornis]
MFREAVVLAIVAIAFCSQNCQPPATGEPCKYPDGCKCPKMVEPCNQRVPRFYFNTTTRMCEKFDWGGCRPNCNNFPTYEDCKKYCGSLAG